jgi:exonuclease III
MDNKIILSWNVCGLNARARQDNVRTLVTDLRPSIVCLQETKLDVVPQNLVYSMLGINFHDYAYLPASNTRGGILIARRQEEVSISDVHVGCYSITVRVQQPDQGDIGDSSWWLSSVYGP